MLPLRDTLHSRSLPVVTWGIVLVNAAVFLYELSLSPAGLQRFFHRYALLPSALVISEPSTWFPLISHMFLHGGWLHFISNMWILFIFGDNVEDRMGRIRYLLFYLLGGAAAGLVQVFFTAQSNIPSLGASGAIAAVFGAYILFYPRARVISFVPLFILPWIMEIPAWIYLGLWFISQLFSGLWALGTAGGLASSGIAWWAHIGGFVAGLLLAFPFTLGQRKPPIYPYQYPQG